ncbi:hypothetical protein [Pelotomaculum sp. PtaB.Bin117]|nr:hypothetical protein [Pelotomaculum sp. PtaB.Bin117]
MIFMFVCEVPRRYCRTVGFDRSRTRGRRLDGWCAARYNNGKYCL